MINADTRRPQRLDGRPVAAPAPAEAVTHLCHPAEATPPRRAALAGAFALWKRCMLRYQISSSERYLALCEREGITEGRTISEWRYQLQEQRRQLAALEGRPW